MSSLNIDDKKTKLGKLRFLLHLLSLGKLNRDYADDLKALLIEELKETRIQNNNNNNINNKSKITPIIVGAAVAIVLFGLYHFAHSPPFNQPNMVIILMYPSLLTSIVYFVVRDIYTAKYFIIFRHYLV
jgi:hypothetical protein